MGWYNPISEKMDLPKDKIPILYIPFLNGLLQSIVMQTLAVCILTGNVHLFHVIGF